MVNFYTHIFDPVCRRSFYWWFIYWWFIGGLSIGGLSIGGLSIGGLLVVYLLVVYLLVVYLLVVCHGKQQTFATPSEVFEEEDGSLEVDRRQGVE